MRIAVILFLAILKLSALCGLSVASAGKETAILKSDLHAGGAYQNTKFLSETADIAFQSHTHWQAAGCRPSGLIFFQIQFNCLCYTYHINNKKSFESYLLPFHGFV